MEPISKYEYIPEKDGFVISFYESLAESPFIKITRASDDKYWTVEYVDNIDVRWNFLVKWCKCYNIRLGAL